MAMWWPPCRAFSYIYLLLLTGTLTLIDANWARAFDGLDTEKPKRTRREQLPKRTMPASQTSAPILNAVCWMLHGLNICPVGRGARSIVIGWQRWAASVRADPVQTPSILMLYFCFDSKAARCASHMAFTGDKKAASMFISQNWSAAGRPVARWTGSC